MLRILKRIVGLLSVATLLALPVGMGAYSTSFSWAKATITNSAPSTTADYTFEFYMNNALTQGSDTITITFPDDYNSPVATSGDVICPGNMTASVSGRQVICTGTTTAATTTVTVNNVTNPAKSNPAGTADTYTITIETSQDEGAQVMVAIIEPITVTAHVEATLSFTVSGVNAGQTVNGTTTTVTTTATTIPFGTLDPGTTSIAAQEISVTTNASHGFVVNIFQDHDLTNAQGDDINCFQDGTCVDYTNATSWASPAGTLDQENTYGHFGITSQDNSLGTNCSNDYYGEDLWAGLDGTDPAEVMCHTGPADGSTDNIGSTRVGFAVEITALQEAGEYTNTITYIVTPTY